MVCQPLNVFDDTVPVESLYSFDNAGMKRLAALLEKGVVCYLVGKTMLERIFELGKRLVS